MPSLQPLPTQSYEENPAANQLNLLFYAMDQIVFATFVTFLSNYAKNIMEDKETRLRVSFKSILLNIIRESYTSCDKRSLYSGPTMRLAPR